MAGEVGAQRIVNTGQKDAQRATCSRSAGPLQGRSNLRSHKQWKQAEGCRRGS